MEWRRLILWLLVVLWLGGCATNGDLGRMDTLRVGQRESDLVARNGKPQEILPGPEGGKIYVYTTINLDQVAAMGGGAWAKPDQVYYWLDNQEIITRVVRYPYGKRKFLFPTEEPPTRVARAPAPGEASPSPPMTARAAPAPAPPAATAPEKAPQPLVSSPPEKIAKPVTTPSPRTAPAAPPPPQEARQTPEVSPKPEARASMEAATRLELNMTREKVRRILGLPERTEGFRVGSKAVIVWFYLLENRQGRRVATPFVFEDGRLSGWGENHYRRLLREVSGKKP